MADSMGLVFGMFLLSLRALKGERGKFNRNCRGAVLSYRRSTVGNATVYRGSGESHLGGLNSSEDG